MLKSSAQQNYEMLTSARTKLGESYDILSIKPYLTQTKLPNLNVQEVGTNG